MRRARGGTVEGPTAGWTDRGGAVAASIRFGIGEPGAGDHEGAGEDGAAITSTDSSRSILP